MPIRAFRAMSKATLGTVLLATGLACGDPYQHTNPYDPAVSVAITIVGPDTLFSAFEGGLYTAQTSPAFLDTALHWSVSGGAVGHTTTFVAPPPPLWPATSTATISVMIGAIDTLKSGSGATAGPIVPVQFYRHTAQKTVIITQRITHVRLRCPDVSACDTLSVGGTSTVYADALDALDQPLYYPPGMGGNSPGGPAQANFAVRDATIATATSGTRASTVSALKSGTTWIIAARGSLLDSLQLVVR
jgi:hypothetical protein